MDYNYKLLKYKNKFLDQFGGNINESIAKLILNGFIVEEIIAGAGAAFRMFKVTRNDGAIFFIKLMNDYPNSAPIICFNGKNIFNLLAEIRSHEVGLDFDVNKWLAALLVRTTLFNDDRKGLEFIYSRLIVEKSRLEEILEKDSETKQKIRVYNNVLENKKAELERLNTNLLTTVLKEKIKKDISLIESHIKQIKQMLGDLNKIRPLLDGEISANNLQIEELQQKISIKYKEIQEAPPHNTFADILLTDEFLNKIDDICYDMLSVEELKRLKLEELAKKARLEQQIISSKSYLDIIRINKKLFYIYRSLKNIYANLRFKLSNVDKIKSKEYGLEEKSNRNSCKFLLSILAEDEEMNEIKDRIQKILDDETIDINKDDVTDKRLIELIVQFNNTFNSIYHKYNNCTDDTVKSKAVIIKKLKDTWITAICKGILTKYGSKNLSVISFIKLHNLIID